MDSSNADAAQPRDFEVGFALTYPKQYFAFAVCQPQQHKITRRGFHFLGADQNELPGAGVKDQYDSKFSHFISYTEFVRRRERIGDAKSRVLFPDKSC